MAREKLDEAYTYLARFLTELIKDFDDREKSRLRRAKPPNSAKRSLHHAHGINHTELGPRDIFFFPRESIFLMEISFIL